MVWLRRGGVKVVGEWVLVVGYQKFVIASALVFVNAQIVVMVMVSLWIGGRA